LKAPKGIRFVSVVSSSDMERAVKHFFPSCDCLVMTAAVCDYAPVRRSRQKIKRIFRKQVLFERTPDILEAVGRAKKGRQIVVGFCLETEQLRANATQKLLAKNLDLIVASYYSGPQNPFGRNRLSVLLIDRNLKEERTPQMRKERLAAYLTGWLSKRLAERRGLKF